MFYESQLRLVRDTFRKCRVRTGITELSALTGEKSPDLYGFLSQETGPDLLLNRLAPQLAPATVYRLQDPLGCRYLFFMLPQMPADAVLSIGPYISEPLSSKQLMEWAERNGVPPRKQKHLVSYYNALPLLQENSHLFMVLEAFYEQLWGPGGFSVEYYDRDFMSDLPLLAEKNELSEEEDALLQMQNMEMRYNYENELMTAVSKGQLHKANILLGNFSAMLFEQRVADPVRNAKNYCIIMNTLLRKAAQQGGVHPIYLDEVSSGYAVKIEKVAAIESVPTLMAEMFRNYCRLVRKHATQEYSPFVQQALISIEMDLTGDLSLRTLAQKLNISSSYLSTIFKKETGQTLTDLIAQRRVERAKELLQSTRLQIQTIAQHCGIVDVHYFSKIFKKVTGQTPKEYRDSLKR
ncbi:MAG: helix-turn-helix domain-containing protein [Oscillospiraceae bacterium]|nr:helix-turn-helix domain-containing protein [Oscillospiraceae bacterium]